MSKLKVYVKTVEIDGQLQEVEVIAKNETHEEAFKQEGFTLKKTPKKDK